MLSTETLGNTTDFQAIPGCGLVCNVNNVEHLLSNKLSDVEIMNRRNSSSSYKVVIDSIPDNVIPLDSDSKFRVKLKLLYLKND